MPKNLEKFASIFDVMEKKQIFGDIKNQNEHYIGVRNSKLMMDFMKAKKKKEFINKPKDEAPVTISNNYKIQRFNKPEDIIRRNTNAEFNLNLPNNLNLINIAQFETMNIPMENYLNEEQEENYLPLSNNNRIYADDTQNYQTPIDILKNHNIKNTNNNYSNNNSNNYNNYGNTSQSQVPQNNFNSNNNYNNTKSIPEVPIPQINNINNNNNNNTQNQNQYTNNIANKNMPLSSGSNNNTNAGNKITSKPVPIKQNTQNVPKAPPLNLPPPKTNAKVNSNSGEVKKTNTNANKNTQKVKFTGNPSNGKDDIYTDSKKVVEIKEVEKINESRGGLLEALKSDNPMARLRKSGTIELKTTESIFLILIFDLNFILNS